MAEFLHEVVRKRERSQRPAWLTNAYDDLVREMSRGYRPVFLGEDSTHARAQEAINRYMDETTNSPEVGMRMTIPFLPRSASEYGSMVENITYQFTGIIAEGYRGWVRAS